MGPAGHYLMGRLFLHASSVGGADLGVCATAERGNSGWGPVADHYEPFGGAAIPPAVAGVVISKLKDIAAGLGLGGGGSRRPADPLVPTD
jgi:hypothetical protein